MVQLDTDEVMLNTERFSMRSIGRSAPDRRCSVPLADDCMRARRREYLEKTNRF